MGGLGADEVRAILGRHPAPVGTFVETGTHLGTTLLTVRACGIFARLHSIELSDELFALSEARQYPGPGVLLLHHGDSAKILPEIAATIRAAAFFWLDAHWYDAPGVAAEMPCPIFAELAAIAARSEPDVVVVDDVPCFGRRWSAADEGDWTHVTEEAILAALGAGRGRVASHYVMDGKLVVHRSGT